MKAQKGLSTQSTVRGGPGYFPTGYSSGGSGVTNIISDEMAHPGWEGSKVVHFTNTRHRSKNPARVEIFDQDIRPAPGYYKSTRWEGFENGNIPNIDSQIVNENGHIYQFPQDFLHATGILDLQHNKASAPHHWLAPVVELDHSEEMLEDYFENISSAVLRDKIQILRENGYTEDEIQHVIQKVREADILRKFNKPESVIRRSAHAFGQVSTPYHTGPPGNRYPNPVEYGTIRARGGHFGPFQSRGHVTGDELPRRSVSEERTSSGRLPAPYRPFVAPPSGQMSIFQSFYGQS